jgi:hypothetical protein
VKRKITAPEKTDAVARIAGALPRKFDFYHLGVVRMQEGIQDDLWTGEAKAIGFAIEGDVRSALLIRVEFAEDMSVYAEMGNIIASQLATRLAAEHDLDVLISPPRTMSARSVARLLSSLEQSGRRFERRTYLHLHQKTVPVDAWILDPSAFEAKELPAVNEFDAAVEEESPKKNSDDKFPGVGNA